MTTTTATGIKCGNCHEHHATVAEVKACYGMPSQPRPQVPASPISPATERPASDKQKAFILRLCQERNCSSNGYSSSREASAEITRLLAMPKPTPASHPETKAQAVAVTEGMYRVDETIYKVQRALAQGSGHTYAKRLVLGEGYGAKATFVYAPGALKILRPEHKLSLEEAKAWGILYGSCCRCGRTLTDESSIEAGIGPTCSKKGGWA